MAWAKLMGPPALMVLGTVAWFGGLLRLMGEVVVRFWSAVFPEGLDPIAWFSIVATAVLFTVMFRVMFPWYQRTYRQRRADLAATHRVSVESLPSFGSVVRRRARLLATIGGGAL